MAGSVERSFLGWDSAFLPVAADRLVEALTGAHRAAEIVVLPGRRALRRLEELLAERLPAEVPPPRLVTEGALPAALSRTPVALASGLVRELAWSAALRALPGREMEAGLGRVPDRGDLGGWLALARSTLRVADELGREGLDFARAAERAGTQLSGAARARWGLVMQASADAAERLANAGLADPARLAIDLVERELVRADGRVWLLALADLDASRKALLETFGGEVHALVFAPAERGDGFDAWGALLPEAWIDVDVPLADEQWRVVSDPRGCADESTRWLSELAGQGLVPASCTFGVLDAELAPFLQRALREVGVGSRTAAGSPLEPTLPALALRCAADFTRARGSDALASLVRHPAVEEAMRAELGADAPDPLVLLDAYRGEHLPSRLQPPWLTGDTPTEPIEDLVETAERLLGGLAGRRRAPLSTWAEETSSFLARLWSRVRRDPRDPAAWTLAGALEACAEVLGEARALADGPLDPPDLDAATGLSLLCRRLEGLRLAPPPDPDAVELTGWLELVLDEAPHVMLLGFDEGCVPAPLPSDPLLPEPLREALGLVDERRRLARDVWAATAILRSRAATGVRAISLRTTREGDPRRPSRLVFHTPPGTAVQRVRAFFGSQAEPAAVASEERASAARALPLATPRALERMSVTAFGEYLASPYRFYLTRVLGLERVDDPGGELDPLAFGELVHEALRAFGCGELSASTSVEAIEREVHAHLDRLAAATYGSEPPPAVRLQLEQARRRLLGFAAWQAVQAADGWAIERVEHTPRDFALEVDGVPMPVRGRIDRIDRHRQTGAWRVLDYKTGEKGQAPPKPPREPGAWKDLQLPLYHAMLSGELGEAPVQLGYVVLPKQRDSVEFKAADYGQGHLLDALETARGVVRDVRAGSFTELGDFGRREDDWLLAAIAGVGLLQEPEDEEENEEEEA